MAQMLQPLHAAYACKGVCCHCQLLELLPAEAEPLLLQQQASLPGDLRLYAALAALQWAPTAA